MREHGKTSRGRGRGGYRGSFRARGRGFRGHGERGRTHCGGRMGHAGADQDQGKRNNFPPMGPRLSENDVGITEFISKHSSFSAVMKHRLSDFQVNEIDSEGKVVKLTSFNIPEEEAESCAEVPKRHELIPEEIWEKLLKLTKRTGKATEASGKKLAPDQTSCQGNESIAKEVEVKTEAQHVELDVTSLDKDCRRAIHVCVKEAFKELNSNTIERDGKKFVTFNLRTGAKGENRGRWPKSRNGTYLHFVVHKRNMDTSETVTAISQKLGMKPSSLTFSGTKDRRGITSQLMCINRGEPKRMFSVSKGVRNVFIGNYSFKDKPLHLGDLKGNQFRIALRNVEGSDDQINAGMESIKNNGFINYFGLQRFGTNVAVPTHSVGKALLLGDWQKAVDLILSPRESFPNVTAALNEWKSSKNAENALQKLGTRSTCLEGLLLRGLAKHGSHDLVNALSMLPRNTRLMYLHAYQSFIWNKSVSQRIKEYGLKPVPGDLILVRAEKNLECEDVSIIDDDVMILEPDEAIAESRINQEVRLITEGELENFSIEDVVLPLPGYDVIYPKNSIGNFIIDLLKDDGLCPESLKQTVRQYSVKGTYRRIVALADKLSWEINQYNDPNIDFILSDYDEMQKKECFKNDEGGKYKALIFSMCLEPSTYATMVIREITKQDTSATAQMLISTAASSTSTSDGDGSKNSCKDSEHALEEKADDALQGLVPEGTALSSSTDTAVEDIKDLSKDSESRMGGESMEEVVPEEPPTASSNSPTKSVENTKDSSEDSGSVLKRKADDCLDEIVAEKRTKDS